MNGNKDNFIVIVKPIVAFIQNTLHKHTVSEIVYTTKLHSLTCTSYCLKVNICDEIALLCKYLLPNITVLGGSYQHVKYNPNNLSFGKKSEAVSSEKIVPGITLPKQLKYLYLHHMDAYIGSRSFHVSSTNTLGFVDLSNNSLLEVNDAPMGFNAIKFLN